LGAGRFGINNLTFNIKIMKEHSHYQVITGDTLEELQEEVNLALEEGYHATGGVIYTGTMYCQAVILVTKSAKEATPDSPEEFEAFENKRLKKTVGSLVNPNNKN
jgi:hypothetical protein